ncbi:MAG: hypothetical protein L0H25_01565 [Micrococcales bacterium]|nr:hypothetical protein [Micrococcales bacterium]
MAGRTRLVGTVVRLSVKYGPPVWVASQALREPAKEAVHKIIASERARKSALAHARTLSEGSILKVYRGDQSLWIVFTGDTAITVHPPTDVELGALLRGADLTRRIRPDDPLPPKERVRDATTSALRRGKPDAIN